MTAERRSQKIHLEIVRGERYIMTWRAVGRHLIAFKQKMHARWINFQGNLRANGNFRANTKPNSAASIIASTRVTKSKILISSDFWESVLLLALFCRAISQRWKRIGLKAAAVVGGGEFSISVFNN